MDVEEHKRINREYYDQTANTFNEDHFFNRKNRNHLKKVDKIIEKLELKDGDSVLEIGVATGIHADAILKERDVKYTGLDISAELLKEADKVLNKYKTHKKKNVKLVVGEGENLPFKDNSFDAVFISSTLHHLSDPEKGILELVRVLKPGKNIMVMEPNKFFIKNFVEGVFKKFERNVLKMTKKNLRKWGTKAKLKDMEITNFIYSPPVPKFMIPFYNWLDDIGTKIPIFSHLSIMIYMHGRKKK